MPEPMLTASVMFANAARFADAYHTAIAPLCASTGLPPAAADILLFLANNPGCETAGEICRMRGMKPALVSFHIDRLVGEGYLLRQPVPGDRRKLRLEPTEKASSIIARGRQMQERFAQTLAQGLSPEELSCFARCMETISQNLERAATGME